MWTDIRKLLLEFVFFQTNGRWSPGDAVLMKTDGEQTWDMKGTVVATDPGNRTYLVNSPSGVFRRNRKHLQQLSTPRKTNFSNEKTANDDAAVPVRSDSQDIVSQDDGQDSTSGSGQLPDSDTKTAPHNTRSSKGYIAQKPLRFDGEVAKGTM